jgi:uncharacterized phage infection (PIP) family protein YhgE
VSLVRSTGDALVEIAQLVERVNSHVETIATASREQATALQEINASVNQMDQMTQQNAAMVEETTAASQTLADQSLQLQHLLSAFRMEGQVAPFALPELRLPDPKPAGSNAGGLFDATQQAMRGCCYGRFNNDRSGQCQR